MDFNMSVSCFTQQITYISKLVSKCNDSLRSMALTGHLLEVTSPNNFTKDKVHVSHSPTFPWCRSLQQGFTRSLSGVLHTTWIPLALNMHEFLSGDKFDSQEQFYSSYRETNSFAQVGP